MGLKGSFDRRDSLVWIYFRLCAVERNRLDSYISLLPWVRTWIEVNNIVNLTPEGWFKEGHGFKRGKKNDDGIWMLYHSK